MRKNLIVLLVTGLVLCLTGCDRGVEPGTDLAAEESIDLFSKSGFPPPSQRPPSPLVQVTFGAATGEFWPFTGRDFASAGQDPINLIFVGDCDLLSVRAALKSLDGVRPDFPDAPPFTARWVDAIGEEQVAYGSRHGWTGSVIQMECGDHNSVRVHLRLFTIGDWTVGNAHFEVLIPGTTEHEVLSWELAEQLVVYDFMRSGLLDGTIPLMPTDPINPSPFRAIRAPIYNGLPIELRMLVGGPLGDVAEDVPIATDGKATLLNLTGSVPWAPETYMQDFTCNWNQAIPKPFCSSGPYDVVYVTGPVSLRQQTVIDARGFFHRNFEASGRLTVTPIDPMSGTPLGSPLKAIVGEQHSASLKGSRLAVTSYLRQQLLPSSVEGAGRLVVQLRVSTVSPDGYRRLEECTASEPVVSCQGDGVKPIGYSRHD